jgi:hypothetical protein
VGRFNSAGGDFCLPQAHSSLHFPPGWVRFEVAYLTGFARKKQDFSGACLTLRYKECERKLNQL